MSTSPELQSPHGMATLRGETIPHPHPWVPHRDAALPLPVFYINRDCDDDRRAGVERELRRAGLAAQRISAIDGLAVPEGLRDYFFDADKQDLLLKPGEVGCYASHLKTLEIIVERGLEYALVLEDDALLPRDLRRSIEDLVARLPEFWDLVHLGGDARRAAKPVGMLDHGRTLVRYSRVPNGAFGYLISGTGAQKFLAPVRRHWPFDTDMKRPWLFGLEIYGVVPKLIAHDDTSPSRIQATGGRARRRRGLPIPSRASWTGNPLHSPEGAYYNLKTLGPLWWASCFLQNAFARVTGALGLPGLVHRTATAAAQVKARFARRETLAPDDTNSPSERACQTS